ncbi:hypothetical protein [Sulfuricystis multivorans]|uniref:hypothetical protein n=1 Tax=Sulfuricystis multivorans TaxID=2211108 RepID=UPI000F81DE15|nr:hypothetical protein [Sulfuricystis multivorans]
MMRSGITGSGLFAKLLGVIVGTVLLVVGFMFSLVVLAVAVVLGIAVWGWFWWRTRALRKALREAVSAGGANQAGEVIEGEAVIVEEEITRVTSNRLPGSPDHH